MTGTLLRTLPTLTPEAELLGRFVASRDEPSFAELVRRHGPVVYRVCRRIVGQSAADDAFQATFLVLATRAEKVRKAASVGSWLVGVAGRVARQMRRQANRRCEPPGDLVNRRCEPPGAPDTADLAAVLDDELARLPDELRAPLVACLVQHRTHQQAAAELGSSERTVRRRLDEAKQLLRERLERRGVVPAVAAALMAGVGQASADLPVQLPERAVGLVFDFFAGGAAVRSCPAAIAKGVTMSAKPWTVTAAVLAVAVGVTVLGVGLAGDPPKAETIPPVDRRKPDPKPLNPYFTTDEASSAEAKTKNFVVTAADQLVARAVAAEAEHQRKAAAERWLGKELPAWDKPCAIAVEVKPTQPTGVSTFTYGDAGKSPTLKSAEMTLSGSLENLLRVQVPHEVTHAVLATHFGKPLPRWADEGVAVTAESYQEQAFHDAKVREMLNGGRGIPLRKLLPMTDYPKDVPVLYAQGHSLVRFLLERPAVLADIPHLNRLYPNPRGVHSHRKLLDFIADGVKANTADGWNAAAMAHYGFADVGAMQESWIEWLRTPGASLADALPPQKPKRADERKGDSDLIPPTRLEK